MPNFFNRRWRRRLMRMRLEAQAAYLKAIYALLGQIAQDGQSAHGPTLNEDQIAFEDRLKTSWIKKQSDLHTEIGEALSKWAMLESELIDTAAIVVGLDREKAGIVFFSIINFNTWLQIIADIIVTQSTLIEFSPRWNKVSGRLKGLKTTRDRLAHHTTLESIDIHKLPTLSAPKLDGRRKNQKFTGLTASEISRFSMSIDEARDDLFSFAKTLILSLTGASPEIFEQQADHRPPSDTQ